MAETLFGLMFCFLFFCWKMYHMIHIDFFQHILQNNLWKQPPFNGYSNWPQKYRRLQQLRKYISLPSIKTQSSMTKLTFHTIFIILSTTVSVVRITCHWMVLCQIDPTSFIQKLWLTIIYLFIIFICKLCS